MHLCKYVVFMMSLNDFQHFDEIDCDTSNELNVRTRITVVLKLQVFKSGLLLPISRPFIP